MNFLLKQLNDKDKLEHISLILDVIIKCGAIVKGIMKFIMPIIMAV